MLFLEVCKQFCDVIGLCIYLLNYVIMSSCIVDLLCEFGIDFN